MPQNPPNLRPDLARALVPDERRAGQPTIGMVSLGCPKALVDSERILTRLRAEGYAISPSYEGADLVVVNTCGFIDSAVEESLDAIGEEERVRAALFDAIHKENLRITSESAVEEWLGKKGVSIDKYKAAYKSFGVESRLRRATQMTQSYKIDGVPTFAVQGRFVISATLNNEPRQLLSVTDSLVGEARRGIAKK